MSFVLRLRYQARPAKMPGSVWLELPPAGMIGNGLGNQSVSTFCMHLFRMDIRCPWQATEEAPTTILRFLWNGSHRRSVPSTPHKKVVACVIRALEAQ